MVETAYASGTDTRAGGRRFILLAMAAAGVWAFWILGLSMPSLSSISDTAATLGVFLGHALAPALRYESAFVPEGAPPLLLHALDGARRTVVFATAAMTLAVPVGLVLAFAGSSAWWAGDRTSAESALSLLFRRTLAPAVYAGARVLITFLRSIHELLWAVLFLSAFGLSNVSAVFAIALPFSGVLAKVFSEMIDEAPRDAAKALRSAGAGPAQVYLFGLVPRALPDMGAYAIYRFECALRSSAILGFFGPETLGKFIKLSWEENHYGEVWTYLYTLFALVVLVDWWSGALRRRFAA